MQVLLKDPVSGLYYAGRDARTPDPLNAFDFHQINEAARRALDEHLAAMRIVLHYESPLCELRLPVNPEWIEAERMQPN
jgi:hypothetical protein